MKALPPFYSATTTLVERKLIGLLVNQIRMDGPVFAYRMSSKLTTSGMVKLPAFYKVKVGSKGLPVASYEKGQSDYRWTEGRPEIRGKGTLSVWDVIPLIKDLGAVRMTLMTCALDPDDQMARRLIKNFLN